MRGAIACVKKLHTCNSLLFGSIINAQVRLYHNHVQIYVDNVPVADVPLTDVKEYYVPQGQQHSDLAALNGIAWNYAIAIRTEKDVTGRPLKTYDWLMGAMTNA